ncbi:MAG: S9 family peptidase, partial [Proteobacteria bacterium]|nr:S9 family peptidase [Pseudomonadota bacterium]
DVLPAPFSARSRVHEYGGAEFMVADGVVYFVNADDQDIWCLAPGGKPERLTSEPRVRFADMTLDRRRRRLIAVAERHGAKPDAEPENLLVAVALEGTRRGKVAELVTGRDFYAFPSLSPDGTRLAFLAWDLPDMPWDQSALHVTHISEDGSAGRVGRPVAGGAGVAAMQPAWLDDQRLLFLSDETGFGNLMLWDGAETRALTRLKAELGLPMWNLGPRTFVIAGPDRVVASGLIDGAPSLVTVTGLDKRRPEVAIEPVRAASIGSLAMTGDSIATVIGREKAPAALATLAPKRKAPAVIRTATDLELDPGGISVGRTISFRGGDRKATFAQFYAPSSAASKAPRGALPPALVLAHGGPTSQAGRGLGLRIQYYTSRGFAVLDVDYSGSTGYGRAYRERLDGQWGIADVADCVAGAKHLASAGLADPDRLAIAGGSAGGYTVLMALATTNVFAAGSSHYGISDLTLLMEHTHKF